MTERDDLLQTGMNFLKGAMWYQFNTPHQEILKAIFGEGLHENYYAEKQENLQKRGLLFLYGEVDEGGRKRLVEAIFDRYGKDFD
tara:strand:+ start:473 stop:727 length:255 start_codon:yes stop_codon:yes gene_type:complete